MKVYKVNKAFGKKMQKIRKSLGLSQEELGFRVSVHRNHIGRIERGESSPPLQLIEKISKVLKMPMSELFK